MPKGRAPRAEEAQPQLKRRAVLPVVSRMPKDSNNFSVVGIGASAGGLESCRKLVSGFPAGNGMAFILIQHLDPTHESMMVRLLVGHTSMTVRQAADGMRIEPDHLYVIPPATYLSVAKGNLRLSSPKERHGARLPFDFFLHSLAEEYGPRAVCVVLSGAGADGSLGLKTIKEKGGFIIAQDAEEAAYDGMPRSAIKTGAVDLVLPVAKIPQAIIDHTQQENLAQIHDEFLPQSASSDWLSSVIELLRKKTVHDFTLYKEGTLRRRIERRMALLSIKSDETDRYLKILESDDREVDLLAKDLLINVTNFFRDPDTFKLLAETIVPDLILKLPPDQTMRIWIAGCSTGEEAYSLAIIFKEQIAATKRHINLQIFASDVDSDAIASAREGLYQHSIEADVSRDRLAHYFIKDNNGYRVTPELRAMVIFTVQDVLKDPPFSRIDLISCRNVLIYLSPQAQSKIFSIFDFALRKGGLLLLGGSETVGRTSGLFEIVSKQNSLYRHIGIGGLKDFHLSMNPDYDRRNSSRPGQGPAPSRQNALADLCQRLVMESHSPAAVLINRKHESLYFLGPTDNYFKVTQGQPNLDLLTMAREGLRTPLRSAIKQASKSNALTVVPGVRINHNGKALSFSISVHPVLYEGEELQLICFIDETVDNQRPHKKTNQHDDLQVTELEKELELTRAELQSALRDLQLSGEEQKAINEEAMSVNEEFQSANEELLTSKEELQSLNEELTALNYQLQETLEMQRATSDDLQNVLYSTDIATLFLDQNLKIRFFTPATKLHFKIIPSDIGRPLADLNSLNVDHAISADCRAVLHNRKIIEREIETPDGVLFIRKVLPYRTHDNKIEGVVITFTDITDMKSIAKALEAAKQKADLANAAKSRFLAVASHDLRQPLQTLSLLQGLLAKIVKEAPAKKLIVRIEESLVTITGMLNTLLDINEIEAGTVRPEITRFQIKELIDRLGEEFSYHALEQNIDFRMVPCSLFVLSDIRLLEQMIRNLLSNAFKFTKNGKVLLGCRQRAGKVRIEIWDTGIGICDEELQSIFEEYHQVDNPAHERTRGLGLGLSIVKRLADILGHQIQVSSRPGKGSVFSIDIALPPSIMKPQFVQDRIGKGAEVDEKEKFCGAILCIEDDPEVRELLEILLNDEGHDSTMASDGIVALELLAQGKIKPDLILADYNLPNGMNGLQVIAKLRTMLNHPTPGIILTGDITTNTTRNIELQNCVKLNKPVKARELTLTIQRLLQTPPSALTVVPPAPMQAVISPEGAIVIVIDDEKGIRDTVRSVLEDAGLGVEDYASSEAFLKAYRPGREVCLLIDASLPGMSGLELLRHMNNAGHRLPAIIITGFGDVPMAVEAMKSGASDFIEKPINGRDLIASIEKALETSRDATKVQTDRDVAAAHIAGLTSRQRQIMDMVLAGHPSKNIAADLGISQRTVENHRAAIMEKTGSKSLPSLARLAFSATLDNSHIPAVRHASASRGISPKKK